MKTESRVPLGKGGGKKRGKEHTVCRKEKERKGKGKGKRGRIHFWIKQGQKKRTDWTGKKKKGGKKRNKRFLIASSGGEKKGGGALRVIQEGGWTSMKKRKGSVNIISMRGREKGERERA